MPSTHNNSLNSQGLKSKDSRFNAQMKIVNESFSRKAQTMLMVSIETGILRANICRYVAKWKRENKIHVVRIGFCEISKHLAGYYSTNIG